LNTTVATVDIDTKSTGLEFICRLHAEGEKKRIKNKPIQKSSACTRLIEMEHHMKHRLGRYELSLTWRQKKKQEQKNEGENPLGHMARNTPPRNKKIKKESRT
jgi:hypothetical protein